MRRSIIALVTVGGALCVPSGAWAAGNPFGVDHHANCTGGFAVSQTLGGDPGATALSTVARPPKSEGPASDVGALSSTNCI
jgi:hypothetical protein